MLEHPDITSAVLTGYPRKRIRMMTSRIIHECDSCGEPLTNCAWFIEVGGERMCDSCVMDSKLDPSDAIEEIEREFDEYEGDY